MKKIYLCLLGLLLLLLLFFTLFGKSVYTWGKPVVETGAASSFAADGKTVYIPKEALRADSTGDYVYLLSSEQGYSRVIYTISRVEVTVNKEKAVINDEDIPILASGKIGAGDRLVIGIEGTVRDGSRVVLAG